MRIPPAIRLAIPVALAAALTGAPAGAAAASGCDVYASAAGSDAATGTATAPLATAQAVVDRLRAGQTGCLGAGTYTSTSAYVVHFSRAGTSDAPITLRSAPGERATLRGIVTVPEHADYVTIADLDIDGRPVSGSSTPTSIQINATDTTLSGNDITNRGTAICSVLGYRGWGEAIRTKVTGNTFHDCGDRRQRMQDHSVYVDYATDVTVTDNLFLRTAGYAVHLYPEAQRSVVSHNVMVDNGGGVIFAGEGSTASNDNVVEDNVITGSTTRPAVESYWGGPKGTNNVARNNCVAGNPGGNVDTEGAGFSVQNNPSTPVVYMAPANGDYRLAPGSPCLSVVGYDAIARRSGAQTPAPTAAPGPDTPVAAPTTSAPNTSATAPASTPVTPPVAPPAPGPFPSTPPSVDGQVQIKISTAFSASGGTPAKSGTHK